MTPDELIDYTDRLERACTTLNHEAEQAREDGDMAGMARLRGKASGVALAIDYLRGYR